MAFSDLIIRQCGSKDADSNHDLHILWRMLKMMKTGFIRYLFAIIFMSAALSAFDMITALLFKNIVFRIENYAQRNMFAGLWKELLACVGIGLLMLFIYALSFYVYTMEAKKGGANLQKALYSKCMRLPFSYYEQTGSSDFMSKVINDCERAQGIYGSRFRRVLMPFLMMSFYLIGMLILSWQVTLCLFGASVALFVINGMFIKPMQRVSREMSTTNVSITERISNILSGMEQIKIFSLKSVMVEQYIEENENKNIIAEKNTENELLLNVYTDISEFGEKEKNKYSGIVEYNFEEIVELINKMLANGICINPNAEKFKIKNNELMELKRQMNFSGSNEEFRLSQNDDFIKPAYRISELKSNSNRIIEIYDRYLKDNNEETLNEFFKILVNESTFYSLVLPEENAKVDGNGHPLISKNRVLQNRISENKANYYLFLTVNKMIEFIGANENSYISIFNFDDYMTLIDSNWNRIEALRIVGDLDLTIPVNELERLKFIHDKNKNEIGQIVLINKFDKKEIRFNLKRNKNLPR